MASQRNGQTASRSTRTWWIHVARLNLGLQRRIYQFDKLTRLLCNESLGLRGKSVGALGQPASLPRIPPLQSCLRRLLALPFLFKIEGQSCFERDKPPEEFVEAVFPLPASRQSGIHRTYGAVYERVMP
jgi:hypothetical protein